MWCTDKTEVQSWFLCDIERFLVVGQVSTNVVSWYH